MSKKKTRIAVKRDGSGYVAYIVGQRRGFCKPTTKERAIAIAVQTADEYGHEYIGVRGRRV